MGQMLAPDGGSGYLAPLSMPEPAENSAEEGFRPKSWSAAQQADAAAAQYEAEAGG